MSEKFVLGYSLGEVPSSREDDPPPLDRGGKIGADRGDRKSGVYIEWRDCEVAEAGGCGRP